MLTKHRKISFSPLDGFRPDQMPSVRELAVRIKANWKAGRTNDEIKLLVTAFHSQMSSAPSMETASNQADVKLEGAWTWEILRSEYLEWAKKYKSDATHSTYHSALGAARNSAYEGDFLHLKGKAIANITQLDILTVRQNILERGGMVDGIPMRNIRAAEQPKMV